MAQPPLCRVSSLVCKYAARGSRSSTIFSRGIEVAPASLFLARPALQVTGFMPPRAPDLGVTTKFNYLGLKDLNKVNHWTTVTATSEDIRKGSAHKGFTDRKSKIVSHVVSGWKTIVDAMKRFFQEKFPKLRGSYLLGILDKLSTYFLERVWNFTLGNLNEFASAAFWGLSGMLFLGLKKADDGSIILMGPGRTDDVKTEVIQVIRQEMKELSKQQAEGFKKMEEQHLMEWNLLRKELLPSGSTGKSV